MSGDRVVVLVRVRSGTRARDVLRWLRWLVPTALLVTVPASAPLAAAADALAIDADSVESPLSLAEALARASRAARSPEGAGSPETGAPPGAP